MYIRANPTRPIPFVWIFGYFLISRKGNPCVWGGKRTDCFTVGPNKVLRPFIFRKQSENTRNTGSLREHGPWKLQEDVESLYCII